MTHGRTHRTLHLIFALAIALLFAAAAPLLARPPQEQPLAVINGTSYSARDFRNWWANFKEKDMAFPETPDPFIDWHLLAQEAERMELFREPSFQRKMKVFLRARSLILLRNETIDSKITVTDAMIDRRYQEEYQPVWKVSILYFDSRKAAQQAHDSLLSGADSFPDLVQRKSAQGLLHSEKRALRPVSLKTKPAWLDIIRQIDPGGISRPFADENVFVIIRLDEVAPPDPGDFEHVRETIRNKILDEEQERLTRELVDRLRKKYRIEIDQEVLDRINADTSAADLLARPLILTDNGSYPAGIIVEKLKNEQRLRTRKQLTKKDSDNLKVRLVNGMISEIVIMREAMARHYERRQPFKPIYQFYRQHRLNQELLKRLYAETRKAPVTDEEISAYYRDNPDKFSHPETFRYALTITSSELAKKIWLQVMQGDDFATAAQKITGQTVETYLVAADDLPPSLKKVLPSLAREDISAPFPMGDKKALVKLIRHSPASTAPLASVSDMIRRQLQKEKFAARRTDYLKKLRKNSQIIVNSKVWESLKREFTGGK